MSDTGAPPVIPTELQQYNSYETDPKWQIKFTIIWTAVLAFFAFISLPAIFRARKKSFRDLFGVMDDWRHRYTRLPHEKRQGDHPRTPQLRRSKSSIVMARILSALGSVFYWTLPGMGLNAGQVLLILGYIATVLACICTSAPLMTNPNRAGFLAVAQLTPVFLLASKNTALSLLLPPFFAYTKLNFLHRWVGRTLFLSAAIHGALWINNHVVYDIQILGQQKETSGIAAFGVLCVIVLTSLKPVRAFAWGVFYWVHFLAVPAFFITVCYHTIYAAPWIFPPIALYAFDLLMRAARFRLKDAVLIPVDNQMTIIHIPDCDTGFQAGQHLRLRVFFGGRVFESHPLSIMTAPNLREAQTTCITAADMEGYYDPDAEPSSSTSEKESSGAGAGIVLGARAVGDWTKALNQYARDAVRDANVASAVVPGNEESRAGTSSSAITTTTKKQAGVPVQVMFDGPYGGCAIDLERYERVVLVAGGSGATFAIGCMDALVAACAKGDGKVRTRKIHFVWCTRSFGSMSWFSPLLRAIARTAQSANVRLSMTVYVTCMCSPEDVSIPGLKVRVGGRPDVERLVRGVPVGHIGTTMAGSEDELCGCGCVDEALKAQAEEEEEDSVVGDEESAAAGVDEEKGVGKVKVEGHKAREREEAVGVCASGPESLTREAANAVARYASSGREVAFHAEVFSV